MLTTVCSHMNGFFTICKNAISRLQSQPQYGRFDHTEAEKMIKYVELGIFLAKFWHLEHSSSFKID